MIIYSERVIAFIQNIKMSIKNILSKEVGLKVIGHRFYNQNQTYSYPIRVVIYQSKNVLGYFDSTFYELGFNECLMNAKREQLQNVIRHEIAHYLTFIEYGEVKPHGPEFKECCARLKWGEEISKANICMEKIIDSNNEESSIFRKVKKLMALGTSSKENEAEQAILKAQQILLKHNIELKSNPDEEIFLLKRIMKQAKKTAKMCAIGRILETFFVNVVYHRAKDGTYLEILGSPHSVEIAEYVAKVLDIELENLWKQAQGLTHKNSFFMGVAKGYCNQIESLKRSHSKDLSNELIVLEKKLIHAKNMCYKNLVLSRSSAKYCAKSSSAGETFGKKLKIHLAIQKASFLKMLLN